MYDSSKKINSLFVPSFVLLVLVTCQHLLMSCLRLNKVVSAPKLASWFILPCSVSFASIHKKPVEFSKLLLFNWTVYRCCQWHLRTSYLVEESTVSQILNDSGQTPWLKKSWLMLSEYWIVDVTLNIWICWNIILEANAQAPGKVSDKRSGNSEVRRDRGSSGRHQSTSRIWMSDNFVALNMARVPWMLWSEVGTQGVCLPRDNIGFTFPSPVHLFSVFQIQVWILFVCT